MGGWGCANRVCEWAAGAALTGYVRAARLLFCVEGFGGVDDAGGLRAVCIASLDVLLSVGSCRGAVWSAQSGDTTLEKFCQLRRTPSSCCCWRRG